MTGAIGTGSIAERSTVFRTLANENRRIVLASLYERDAASAAVTSLATTLSGDRAELDPEQSLIVVRHDVLPALADAGLVVLDDGDDESVRIASGPPPVESLFEWLTADDRVNSTFTTTLLEALAAPRRRLALSELRHSLGPMEPARLARAVSAREARARSAPVPREQIDRVETSLTHVHLPKLEHAGLVTRQQSTDRFSASVPANVPDSWLDLGIGDRQRPSPYLDGSRRVTGPLARHL